MTRPARLRLAACEPSGRTTPAGGPVTGRRMLPACQLTALGFKAVFHNLSHHCLPNAMMPFLRRGSAWP